MGATFACTRAGMKVTRLSVTAACTSLPGVVLVDDKPCPRLVLVLCCSFHESNGCVTRVAPALLGLLLRCHAALTMPELTETRALAKLVLDPALRPACQKSMCRTSAQKKTQGSGCCSSYHSGHRNVPLDMRSRSARCTSCFTLEQDVQKATWPTVQSLAHRLSRPAAAAVTAALELLSRNRLLALLGRETHDLDLAGINFENCRPWLHRVTAHAAALLAINRSKHRDALQTVTRALCKRGWAERPVLTKARNIGKSIVAMGGHYILTEWQDAATTLLGKAVTLTLTAPGQTVPLATGPVETWTCRDLLAQLDRGTTQFYGCRATGSAAALELLVDSAAVTAAVSIAPIGPEHSYHGSDPAVRAWLEKEAATGVDSAVPASIETCLCEQPEDRPVRCTKKRRRGPTADAGRAACGNGTEAV